MLYIEFNYFFKSFNNTHRKIVIKLYFIKTITKINHMLYIEILDFSTKAITILIEKLLLTNVALIKPLPK